MNIFSTIRFRLTLLYSLVVFAFCGLFILAINLYISNWVNSEPPVPAGIVLNNTTRPGGQALQRFADLAREEQERIKEFRIQDMLQLRRASILALFPMAGASFLAGFIISGKMLKPLSTLNQQMQETDTTTLGNKIIYDGPDDEIGQLIKSFNTMANRLSATFRLQEQFIQDASHELKTPLAVIQTNLEMVFEDDEATDRDLKNAVKAALDGTASLNRLVEDLLTLSLQQQKHEKIDLVELVEEQTESLSPLFKKTNAKLVTDFPKKKITTTGNKFLLGRAVRNLLENAVKYGKEDHPEVRVKITAGNAAIISVQDNGQGIAKSDQARIFERFFRADNSRSKTKGGFGLGLAIVKKIIEDHDGSVTVSSKPGATIFTIRLPLST